MDELKAEAHNAHERLNQQITSLLNDDKITAIMATSLLNDFNYTDDTAKNLLDAAQALMASHTELLAEAAQEVILDDDEIEQMPSS
jgi:phosphate:Na+ symporter